MRRMRQMKIDSYEVESDTRENFESIEEYVRDEVIGRADWKHFEITIDGAYTSSDPFVYKHNLLFIPKDFLITSVKALDGESSAGTVTILYDNIDSDFIKLSCTSPGATIRMFVGSFND